MNAEKLKIATVFSGIGSFEFALKKKGIPHEIIFACDNGDINVDIDLEKSFEEIKKIPDASSRAKKTVEIYSEHSKKTNFVMKSYLANYGCPELHFYHDIYLLDGTPYKNKIDILVGGSPCQSFSLAGKRKGLEDKRGQLFYEFIRIIREVQPEVFVFENVKGIKSHKGGETWKLLKGEFEKLTSELGYVIFEKVLNAKDFNVPQNRERLFVVGFKNKNAVFRFPKELIRTKTLKDYLDNDDCDENAGQTDENKFCSWERKTVPQKYYLSDKVKNYVMSSGTKNFQIKVGKDLDIAHPILSTVGKMHRSGIDNYITGQGDRLRRLTPTECLRLMGFNEDFKIVVSDHQLYKQAGNSIVVDVLEAILDEILKTIRNLENIKEDSHFES